MLNLLGAPWIFVKSRQPALRPYCRKPRKRSTYPAMVQDWTRDSFPRHPTFQPQYYPADGTTARHQSFSSERYASDVVQRHHSFPQERVGVEADNARFQEGTDSRRPPLMVSCI